MPVDATSFTKAATIIAENGGIFGSGIIFGSIVTGYAFRVANSLNMKRFDIDLEREKELRKQLELKEERINVLHDKWKKASDDLANAKNPNKKTK